MRRPVKRPPPAKADNKYGSLRVGRLINYVMWDGKKTLAESIVYNAFDSIAKETGMDPVEVFDLAIKNASPMVEVRSRRVGGANYQIPTEVRPDRRLQRGLRWIIEAARKGTGNAFAVRLAKEIIQASKNEGSAVKKREDTHKMAEANKAFAHLAW
jgi:small subunit ribosomal protein S7